MNPEIRFDCILVRYAEIGLKGGNRGQFESALLSNIYASLEEAGASAEARRDRSRIIVFPRNASDFEKAFSALKRVFGIASFSPAILAKAPTIESLSSESEKLVEGERTFRVSARRLSKEFKFNSKEVAEKVGGHVMKKCGLKVKLVGAELDIGVELANSKAYLFKQTISGPGGLPVGTSARVVCLVSGGIDSPVAALLALKRGCTVSLLHFSSGDSVLRFREYEKIISGHSSGRRVGIKVVEHAEKMRPIFSGLRKIGRGNWACLFCKKMMFEEAEKFAEEEGAKAIVSGDSVGQVASQTIENLGVISAGVNLPILRPLVFFDKQETIRLARQFGVYEKFELLGGGRESCPFVAKNPVLSAGEKEFRKIAEKMAKS